MARSWTGAALLTAVLAACAAGGPSYRGAQDDLEEGRLEPAIEKLEELRARNPKHAEIALNLGIAYFKRARQELDANQQAAYLADLARAQEHVLAAIEIDPRSSQPHTWLGIIAAYQDDLDGTIESLKNAARLDPYHPVHYTNLAESYIYKGKLVRARRYLRKARDLGAPAIYIEMNEILAAWRAGDYVEARDLFETAYSLNPEVVKVWNEAPVAEAIESFEDFTGFCCSHIACGPYMENACEEMKHEVRHRDVDAETLRQELVLEMEKRRRLKGIYEGRRDVQIVIEEPEQAPSDEQ